MARIRVRAYNVRFGDALLVTVPDRAENGDTTSRHILIDVGNAPNRLGGDNAVFEPVVRSILDTLDGEPLDLYVLTHEHLDHVQGMLHASRQGLNLTASHVWLPGSADPDYYADHPEARKKRLEVEAEWDQIHRFFTASDPPLPEPVERMLFNNNPQSTRDCVDFVRRLIPKPTYVYRGCELDGTHPFEEAVFEIWAPEEDTSIYYGRFRPMALGMSPAAGTAGGSRLTVPKPPSGVDAGSFYDLVERRRRGYFDNLLAIDKAANNTSVVFSLEWRGWTLLFTGDAEERSWKQMNKEQVLRPVHFFKVPHHGSPHGTPHDELLEKVLPARAPDRRHRKALVSTCRATYSGVPSEETLGGVEERCHELVRVGQPEDPLFVDIFFED